ncbi:TMEM175 family protein [uncultured Jatrophihabitans sp.]|uniref:TMEM175 family protein n=1 Tax=uncultured Jatrophihabitans sp. TaxID=1610747 RepID=UPI0035CA77B4
MTKDRLLAFSDGVIAILITIMVLELDVPKGGHWSDLRDDLPVLLAYVVSFVYVGIYWTNHHHMLSIVHRVTGGALWANLHLLFWLSLVPFTTAWMSENDFQAAPVAAYGIDLLGCALAYFVLQGVLLRSEGPDSLLARAVGADRKGKASSVLCAGGIALTFVERWLGLAVYILVALLWFIPDRRVERTLAASDERLAD